MVNIETEAKMDVKVLGGGCPNCKKLSANTEQAMKNCSIQGSVEKVTEIADIMAFGVMSTPALVIDGEVKVAGRIPNVEEIEAFIRG